MNFLARPVPNKNTRSFLNRTRKVLSLVLVFLTSLGLLAQNSPKKSLLVISVDGFPAYYLDSKEVLELTPNLQNFRKKSQFFNRVSSVYPTITYPAHTSMVTGEEPESHGIYSNTTLDPFEKNDSGWMWYGSDISTKTLWSYARSKNIPTASFLWPVTVGNREIDYLVPQYWRKKNSEDLKLLEALSTNRLLSFLENDSGIQLSETSSDRDRFRAAISLIRKKEIQLFFLYTTDLDTAHHGFGVFSEESKAKLKEWDLGFGEILQEWEKKGGSGSAVILVSDHGFAASQTSCSPNVYAVQKGWIDLAKETYDFIFKSSGGSGYFISGKRKELTLAEEESFILDLTTQCPGVIITKRSRPLFPNPQCPMVLYDLTTKQGMVFSSTRKGAVFQTFVKPNFSHGHDPERDDMKTILGYSGPKISVTEPKSIKDTFHLTCKFFDWDCSK